jgi:hypothetical protein
MDRQLGLAGAEVHRASHGIMYYLCESWVHLWHAMHVHTHELVTQYINPGCCWYTGA